MTTRSGSAGRRKWWDDSSYLIYFCLKRKGQRVGRRCMVHLRMDNDGWVAQLEQPKTAIAPFPTGLTVSS